MKPPRIPTYLKDAPLVWDRSYPVTARIAEVVDVSFQFDGWITVNHIHLGRCHLEHRSYLVPLTKTARQILAGEWR